MSHTETILQLKLTLADSARCRHSNSLRLQHHPSARTLALRLSRYFGNSPEFWLSGQREVDLWEVARAHKDDLKRIKPATAA